MKQTVCFMELSAVTRAPLRMIVRRPSLARIPRRIRGLPANDGLVSFIRKPAEAVVAGLCAKVRSRDMGRTASPIRGIRTGVAVGLLAAIPLHFEHRPASADTRIRLDPWPSGLQATVTQAPAPAKHPLYDGFYQTRIRVSGRVAGLPVQTYDFTARYNLVKQPGVAASAAFLTGGTGTPYTIQAKKFGSQLSRRLKEVGVRFVDLSITSPDPTLNPDGLGGYRTYGTGFALFAPYAIEALNKLSELGIWTGKTVLAGGSGGAETVLGCLSWGYEPDVAVVMSGGFFGDLKKSYEDAVASGDEGRAYTLLNSQLLDYLEDPNTVPAPVWDQRSLLGSWADKLYSRTVVSFVMGALDSPWLLAEAEAYYGSINAMRKTKQTLPNTGHGILATQEGADAVLGAIRSGLNLP
jgi:hypothetical protein